MADTLNSVIKVDGDTTGAVASLHAIEVGAEKVSAKVKSMRDQINRTADALTAQARSYDEVAIAEQKIGRKGLATSDVSASLGSLGNAQAELNNVRAVQQANRLAQSENDHWNALKNQKIQETKSIELAAINAVKAENAHYDMLKNQWAAANQSRMGKEDAGRKAYQNSVKTAALEMEAFGKTASERAAIRGKIFGIPQAEIDRQVAGLRAVEQQLAKTNPRFNEMGMTAKGTTAALRQVPAQFTDIIVSLQGGQAPLTVLLQQGGQLKDVFGGVGNAFKALSGYIIGLVNPITLAVGTVALLGVAFTKGAAEEEAYNKALITTGNAAGVTADQLSSMAKSVAESTGGTVSAAASALASVASTSDIAAAQFERVSGIAVQMQMLTGVAVAETVKQFSELGKDPVTASEKLNQTTHYLTASIYEQIKSLEDQGRHLEAGALAQKTYADAMEGRIPALTQNLGYVEQAWKSITGAAKGAWDAMIGVGRDTTLQTQIADLQAKLASPHTRSNLWDGGKALDKELVTLQRMLASKGAMAAYDADRVARDEASIRTSQAADKYASNTVKLKREIAKANADFNSSNKTDKDIENYGARLLGLSKSFKDESKSTGGGAKAKKRAAGMDGEKAYGDIMAKESGYAANFTETLLALVAARDKNNWSTEKYNEVVNTYLSQQPGATARARAEATAVEAIEKARNSSVIAHAKELESINDKAQTIEDEVAMYGMSKAAIEELTATRMLDRVEMLRKFDPLGFKEEIARIEEEIAARRRLAVAGTALDGKKDDEKSLKDAEKEGKKVADGLKGDLKSALSEAFRDSKDPIGAFGDALANTVFTRVSSSIANALIDGMIDKAISGGASTSLLGLLGFSDGGAFQQGGVQAFANGGAFHNSVLTKATPFKFSSGGSFSQGVAGEAGPEAVMPLTRAPDGRLGVQASGNAAPVQNVTVNYHMVVGDVASGSQVRQAIAGSERRIAAGIGRSMSYGGALA